MPNYEEVIQQSQENIKSLSEKLKDLDKLHQDIKELIKQPEIFDTKYQQIVKLSEEYTNTLGAATKKYLDGNNTLFTANLNELSNRTKDLQKEISRLVNTDFTKLFQDLQKSFIDQTRKDLAIELKKFDDKSTDLQTKIDELREQVERLEKIDLEKHFDKLQKTLTDIFTAVNGVNISITSLTQVLSGFSDSLGSIKKVIDSNHEESLQKLKDFTDKIENRIQQLESHNNNIINELKRNTIFTVAGAFLILIATILIVAL